MGFELNKEDDKPKESGFSLDKKDDQPNKSGFSLDKDAAKTGNSQNDENNKPSGNKGLIFGILAVVVIGIVIFLFMPSNDDSEIQTADTNEQSISGEDNVEDDASEEISDSETTVVENNDDDISEDLQVQESNAVGSNEENVSEEVNEKSISSPPVSNKTILMTFGKASSSASIGGANANSIDDIVGYMKSNTSVVIEISGYASSEGSMDVNQRLSKRRAESLASVLKGKGISQSRIKTVGKGISNPVASNSTEEGREQNRRVEVSFN
ncbi:OmpA family protein [Crocinitomicaceae bacterium]|nr:OmpA family protein [Crocinitomicaceae bacterium]